MNYSPRRLYAETHSLPSCDHFRPWPISAGKLASLIDLGWSDYRIACYFCVEPVKVSALRAYFGLVGHPQDSSGFANETAASLGKRGMNIIVAPGWVTSR